MILRASRGWRAPLCALALLCALAAGARAAEDEIIPQGVWLLRMDAASRTDRTARDSAGNNATLLAALVPDPLARATIQGDIERSVVRVAPELTIGLRDTWNLALRLPWARVQQTSTLATASADPALQAVVAGLQTRTVSGAGAARLASLHRPVFSDRHGFVVGYGLEWPLDDPASPWAGRGTLLVDSPFDRLFGVLHYTFYPGIERARLDLRGEVGLSHARDLTLAGGTAGTVTPGNDVQVHLGWSQEFGPLYSAIAYRLQRQGKSIIDGAKQDDRVIDGSVRLSLGFSNGIELEQGPIAFPYAATLDYDATVHGAGTPNRREVRLSFQFYF